MIIPLLPPIGEYDGKKRVRLSLPIHLTEAFRERGIPLVYDSLAEAARVLRSLEGVTLYIEGDKVMQIGVPRIQTGVFEGFNPEPVSVGRVMHDLRDMRMKCRCPGVIGTSGMVVTVDAGYGPQTYAIWARPDPHYLDKPGCVQGFQVDPWDHLMEWHPPRRKGLPVARLEEYEGVTGSLPYPEDDAVQMMFNRVRKVEEVA